MNATLRLSERMIARFPREEFVRLRELLNNKELCERYGCSLWTLQMIVRHHGLPPRKRGGGHPQAHNRKPLPPGVTAESLSTEIASGVTMAEVCRRYGVERKVVLRWMGRKRADCKPRAERIAEEEFESMMLGVG